MSTSPQLSVIIPTYNRAPQIAKTLESVRQQTYSDYEVILVDDGSTDCTEEILARFSQKRPAFGKRLRYFFQRNQGKSVALNYGLSEARGEWIAFLDSDDLWLPNKIEEQFRALKQFAPESQACFTDARFINNPYYRTMAFERAGKRYPHSTGVLANPMEFISNPFGVFMQSLLLHSSLLNKVGEFDPTLRVRQDIDFIFRVALETRLCFVNAPLVLIDRTPKRSEGLIELLVRDDPRSLDEQQRMYDKWLSLSEELTPDIRRAIRGHLRGTHSEWANWFLTNKQYREARRALSNAAHAQLTAGTTAKWCLAVVAPAVARSIVIRRSRQGHRHDALVAMGCADVNNPDDSPRLQ